MNVFFPSIHLDDFAVCLAGVKVDLPKNISRINLPVKYSRILARVALGNDWDGAVALQQQFSLKVTGMPKLPDIPLHTFRDAL